MYIQLMALEEDNHSTLLKFNQNYHKLNQQTQNLLSL